ncbi:MAG: Arc family DNA binding domain-containing protein [bacterium]|nr:Arc family DNA binding domain-containing protein [bacterium]
MTNRKSFLLRLEPKLWDEVNAWASQELRSVNSQIEFILREAVKKRKKKLQFQEEGELAD